MKKKTVFFLSIICIIIIIFSVIILNNKTGSEETSTLPVDYNEEISQTEENETQNKINNIIQERGFTENEDIYELAEEYDGRETLIIKSSIQYKVALAGMIKNDIPNFSEIDSLLEKAPTHTGIWIEESSREIFLNMIKNITNGNYDIDGDGFLIKKSSINNNNYDEIIGNMLSDGGLYIFDISSITYLVDEVTGEIQNYPFEDMDPYQGYEYFESDNKYMFIISENKLGKISLTDTLKEILENK